MHELGHGLSGSFSVFGMILVVMGIAGNRKVRILAFEGGPLGAGWRVVAIALGLLVLTGVGAMEYIEHVGR